jgi:lantibiotic biosynthesis protein
MSNARFARERDGWTPVLAGGEAERARSVAIEITSRLLDGDRVQQTLDAAAGRLERTGAPARGWHGPGLSGADATAALLCGQLDRLEPDSGWDRRGHACITAASRAAERPGAPLGLYDGIGGLGYAAQQLARGRGRYGKLLLSVDQVVADTVQARWSGQIDRQGLPVREWDLISGITGLGVYLLVRRGTPGASVALEQVLTALVALAGQAGGAPCWATPPEHLFGYLRETTPQGSLNCGVAHGIPGPLALLSLALEDGIEVAGQVRTMHKLAGWLSAQARPGTWGPQWPAAVPVPDGAAASGPAPADLPAARPGWCYGNAGVARALWLAGCALDESSLGQLALLAIRQALARQRSERPLDAPTLCHGVAGLALVALRMASDSGAVDIADHARNLCLDLMSGFDEGTEFGFCDVATGADGRRLEVDDPTLLSGAAGPALVLLAAATDVDPGWDRAMLLT